MNPSCQKLIGLLVNIFHACVSCFRKASEAKGVVMGGDNGCSNWEQSSVKHVDRGR